MDVVICGNKYILNPLHELAWHVALLVSWQKCHMKRRLEFKRMLLAIQLCMVANMLAGDIVCTLFILEP